MPKSRPLWSPFWNEGEVGVLFSETNVGKSILAVQIANDITNGISSVNGNLVKRQKVLYFDYELSDKQFKRRYSTAKFDKNFYRASPRLEGIEMLDIENAIYDIIRAMEVGYKAIIVDNITFLSNSIKDASNALSLMKTLKANAAQYACSLLLIAHTPKRMQNRPITKADIAGSSNILNFADSAFAMGKSYLDPTLRYIKQIKVRENEFAYDTENVLIGRFSDNGGLLHFEPIIEQSEYLHLEK